MMLVITVGRAAYVLTTRDRPWSLVSCRDVSHTGSGNDGNRAVVFEHRHPIEGFLRFVRTGDVVHVDCRWPFDRETGEWIFIANDVAVGDYMACLEQVVEHRRGRASGIGDGFIEFAEIGADQTQLEICEGVAHAPTRLSLRLPEDAESFGRRLQDALRQS